jgi:hypothetical protein
MASVMVASAFVIFLFMSAPSKTPEAPQGVGQKNAEQRSKLNSNNKKIGSESSKYSTHRSPNTVLGSPFFTGQKIKGGAKKKVLEYIKKSNPKIPRQEASEIAHWIDEYATKENIDPMLVAALIGRESSFNKTAVSQTGAKGLGQIKDFNFDSLGIKDPYNIKQNVRGTVLYLKTLASMWKDSSDSTRMALASYYQGPTATKKKQKLPDHVTNYVNDILKKYETLSKK